MPRANKKCEGCDATVPAHRWGMVRAGSDGWFFQKDGRAYCPKHVPDWVTAWREKNRVDGV
jgi:hypothetical protein